MILGNQPQGRTPSPRKLGPHLPYRGVHASVSNGKKISPRRNEVSQNSWSVHIFVVALGPDLTLIKIIFKPVGNFKAKSANIRSLSFLLFYISIKYYHRLLLQLITLYLFLLVERNTRPTSRSLDPRVRKRSVSQFAPIVSPISPKVMGSIINTIVQSASVGKWSC